MKQYTKALFSIDEGPQFIGYHIEDNLWNGWAQPCFELPELQLFIADTNEQLQNPDIVIDDFRICSNGNLLRIIPDGRKRPDLQLIKPFDIIYEGEHKTVYDLSCGYCWDVDPIPGGLKNQQTLTIVSNAIYGYFLKIDSYSMLNGIVVRIDPIQADRLRIDGVDMVQYENDAPFWNANDILPLSVPNEVFKRNNSLNNLTGLL